MTTVLGIAYAAHDTGAAVLKDGDILGAVNEDRLSRVKRESRFPSSSVNYLLSEYTESIDEIAVSATTSPYLKRNLKQLLSMYRRRGGSTGWTARSLWRAMRQPESLLSETAEMLASETKLDSSSELLKRQMSYVEHHRSHAASAYYTSGFDDATILTIDAAGDGFSSTVFEGRNGEMTRIYANDDVDSIGKLWAQIPTVFGFQGAKHAGKFMGMAAYVDEVPSGLRSEIRDILRVDGLDIINTHERESVHEGYEAQIHRLKEKLGGYETAAVAHALQDRTEEVIAEFASAALDETGIDNFAISGGVAANVKVNQRIFELSRVNRLFVHPNMGDGGLGVGAALALYADEFDLNPSLIEDVYFGPQYGMEEVEQATNRLGIPDDYSVERFECTDSLAENVADILANGSVVSLYKGRLEYGPRALGNRSILYQPTDPSAIEWLNERLNRTEFMPFAPVTLRQYAGECYENYDEIRCPSADFMTMTFDCTEKMAKRSPGVVHVDGTARPQIVDANTQSLYTKILEAYREQTGIPTLINTSFNMHGEPIVCKPAEALRSYLQTENEALVMEQTLIQKGS